jgi:hypothetical protein
VRGLKKSAPLKGDERPEAAEPEEGQQADEEGAEYEGPKLEKRQVVASRKSWPSFGPILASAAWLAGFAQARGKAKGTRKVARRWC